LRAFDVAGPVARALENMGTPVYNLTGSKRHDAGHVWRLAKLVRDTDIDVLHTHLPYASAAGILAGALAAGRWSRRSTVCGIRISHSPGSSGRRVPSCSAGGHRSSSPAVKKWGLRHGLPGDCRLARS